MSGGRRNFALYLRPGPFSDTLDLRARPRTEAWFVVTDPRDGRTLGEGDAEYVADLLDERVAPRWRRPWLSLRRLLRRRLATGPPARSARCP